MEIHPGESIELPVAFGYWPGLKGHIYAGREWRFQEGATLAAIGTITEVLSMPDVSET